MKKIILLGIPFLLMISGCDVSENKSDSGSAVDDSGFKSYQSEDSVRAAFDNYKAAILNDKGSEAVKYVDSRTIKYYDMIIEVVKTADSLELESLSLLDKFMALTVRYRATKEEIHSFDGEKLLVYAINSGMVGKSSVANNSVGKVTIVDDFASGVFVSNGKTSPFDFHFYYENGGWKIDLTSIFGVSETAFKQVILQSGYSENEFLKVALESTGASASDQNIWEPVQM